jgi:colanic acid/amylovoran biosynthesis glycosyltransferase
MSLSSTLKAFRLMRRKEIRELSRKQSESWGKLFALATVGARLAAICKRDAICHVHVHSCADAAYLAAFSRLSGGPSYSLSLHGDLAVYGNGHEFKIAHSKFIACVTEALGEQVKAQIPGLAFEPKLIRMGIEYDPDVQKVGNWSPRRSLRIVTVSRLNPMKGHVHAIRAVGELLRCGYSVAYDIVGEGDHQAAIESCIQDAGLNEHIRMVGTVANDQIPRLLTGYDAFVLPSVGLGEAAPVAVMEAMSVGVPVICSIIGGTSEMIEHKRTGLLFGQGDEAALANILAQLAEDPGLRQRIGDSGRQHAHKNFLTSRSAAHLVDSIRS